MLTDSHHANKICSCTSCFYKSRSCDPSIQHVLREGSKVDRLYLGKYIPLRERNLLKKLVRTRAVYDDIHCQLMAETGVDATYFIPRQHTSQAYERKADSERSSSLLEFVDQNKHSPHHHYHSMDYCSCCSCGAIRANEYPTQKRRHKQQLSQPHGGLSTSGRGRSRKSVLFKAKTIRSDPCICASKKIETLRQHTRNVKLRPDYRKFDYYFPGYENMYSYNKIKHRKLIHKNKTSNSQLTQSEDKLPKRKESKKTGVTKLSKTKRTETEKHSKITSQSIEQPYKLYNIDGSSFSKDSAAILKDEIEKRRKHYFINNINKYKPCHSQTLGRCYPGECNPQECCNTIEIRRRKRLRKKREHDYTSKKLERHNKKVNTLIKSKRTTSSTYLKNVTSETSSITSQTTKNKEKSEIAFGKMSSNNEVNAITNIENIAEKHAKTNVKIKKLNRKTLKDINNRSQSKQNNFIELGSGKSSHGSFLRKKRSNPKEIVIIRHQTALEKHPSIPGRGLIECLCTFKLHPKTTKDKHSKSASHKNQVLPGVKLDNYEINIHANSKNIANAQSTTGKRKINVLSSHDKSKIQVEPKAAIDALNLLSCECISKTNNKNVSETEQLDQKTIKSKIKTLRSKNTQHNSPHKSRDKLTKKSIATEQSDYKVKTHRLRRCLCSLKLTNHSKQDYQPPIEICDPNNCLVLNRKIKKQHTLRHIKQSNRQYRKSKSTSIFTLSKFIKPKTVLSSFYPYSLKNEKREIISKVLRKGNQRKKSISSILRHKQRNKWISPSGHKCLCPIQKYSNIQKSSQSTNVTETARRKHKTPNKSTKIKPEEEQKHVPELIYKDNQHQNLKGETLQQKTPDRSKLKSNSTLTYKSPPKSKGTLAKSIIRQQRKYPFPTPKRIIKHKKTIPVVDLKIPRQIVRYGSNISFSIEFSKYTYNKKTPLNVYTVSKVIRNKGDWPSEVSQIPSQVRKICNNRNTTLPLIYNYKPYNLYPDICIKKGFGYYENEQTTDQNFDKRTENFEMNSCFKTISNMTETKLLPKENYSKLLKTRNIRRCRRKQIVRVNSIIDLSLVFSQHRSGLKSNTHLQLNRPSHDTDTLQTTSKNCITTKLNTDFGNRINVRNRQSIIKINQDEIVTENHNLAILKFPPILKEKNEFQQPRVSMRRFQNNKNFEDYAAIDETNKLNRISNRQFGFQDKNTRRRTQKKCEINTHHHLKIIPKEDTLNFSSYFNIRQYIHLMNRKTGPNQKTCWNIFFCWMKVNYINIRNKTNSDKSNYTYKIKKAS